MKRSGKYFSCSFCGNEKYFPNWLIVLKKERNHRNFYCSKECYYSDMRGKIKTSKSRKCLICGHEMIVSMSRIKIGKGLVCSRNCAKISASNKLKGRKNPEQSKRMTGRKQTEETIQKRVEKIKGENHYRWISNRDELKKQDRRNDSAYQEWSMMVRERDNFTCRINNEDCKGRLESHHILRWSEYPELRYDINNGITLCQAHHPRKRAEEKRLIPFLQGLVPVSSN